MKICAISDLHGILPSIPECDVLCIAGDVVDLIVQRSSDESDAWWSTAFITWANKLSCEKIFVVPGNHDIYIEQLYNGLIKDITLQEFKDKISLLTNNKVVFLIDELYEYKGVTFYGEIGMFREMPLPEEIADYEPYTSLEVYRDTLHKKQIDNIETDDQSNVFKF